MKIVYVAAPFSAQNAFDVAENVRVAERVGRVIARLGAMPLIPHANTWQFVGLETPEFWYEGTMELLRRCDAIVMGPHWSSSTGAKQELAEAQSRGMEIFYAMHEEAERDRFSAWVRS